MKTIVPIIVATLIAMNIAAGEAVVGNAASEFTGKDINGKTHKLSDYKGKIIVFEAFNLDCPYCANHYKSGAMQELQAWATSKGVVWFVVNSTHPDHPSYKSPAEAKKLYEQYKINATAYIDDSDGTVGKAYGLKTTPHLVIVDKNGIVAYNGAVDNKPDTDGDPRTARNYVKEAIQNLLAGKPVEVKQTKSYGCGVKYK